MAYDGLQIRQHSNPMVFRLLYRLLLQRLNHGADARFGGSALAGRPAAVAPATRPLRSAAKALTLVFGAGVLAAVTVLVLRPGLPPGAGGAGAELRLNIATPGPGPVVAYLRGGNRDAPPPGEQSLPAQGIRSIDGRFSPAFQVLPQLGTLEMSNADTVAHNAHVFSRGETVFNVALPRQGVTVRKVLKGDGIFDVRCDMHPWMKAWLFVSPSPHYAVVHEPTAVTFSDITPGRYILHQWQPGRPESIQPIELGAGETRHLRLR